MRYVADGVPGAEKTSYERIQLHQLELSIFKSPLDINGLGLLGPFFHSSFPCGARHIKILFLSLFLGHLFGFQINPLVC